MHAEHIERAVSAAGQGSRVAIYSNTLELSAVLAKRVEAAVSVPLERWRKSYLR